MSVKLRWKKYPSGVQSAYLDLYQPGGKRRKEFLDIKIEPGESGGSAKTKKKRAEAIRDKYSLAQIDQTYSIISKDRQNADFLVYAANFLDNYHKAGKRKYKYAVKKFEAYLDTEHNRTTIPFSAIDYKLCQAYYDYLTTWSGLKGETPYDYYRRWRSILTKAYKEGYLAKLPTDDISIERPVNQLKKKILTPDELRLLLNTSCPNAEVKKAFLFACFTGLGAKEIKALTWKNIDGDKLTTHRAKNNQPIINKLPVSAIKVLSGIPNDADHLFQLPSDTAINKSLRKWMDSAGIDKHITFYCARHSFAVMLLSAGANLKTVADAMGHTDVKHTMKYLNYVDTLKDEAIDRLPSL